MIFFATLCLAVDLSFLNDIHVVARDQVVYTDDQGKKKKDNVIFKHFSNQGEEILFAWDAENGDLFSYFRSFSTISYHPKSQTYAFFADHEALYPFDHAFYTFSHSDGILRIWQPESKSRRPNSDKPLGFKEAAVQHADGLTKVIFSDQKMKPQNSRARRECTQKDWEKIILSSQKLITWENDGKAIVICTDQFIVYLSLEDYSAECIDVTVYRAGYFPPKAIEASPLLTTKQRFYKIQDSEFWPLPVKPAKSTELQRPYLSLIHI